MENLLWKRPWTSRKTDMRCERRGCNQILESLRSSSGITKQCMDKNSYRAQQLEPFHFTATLNFMTLFTKVWPLNNTLYRTIRRGLKRCLKFLNMLPFWRWEVLLLVEPACLMTTSCRLSINTYSVYWQLPSQKDAGDLPSETARHVLPSWDVIWVTE